MRVVETTAHIGNDGMLRLELPVEERNQDVRVAVVIEADRQLAASAHDPAIPIWEQFREIVRSVPPEELDKLPTDGAANHDNYVYGNVRASK